MESDTVSIETLIAQVEDQETGDILTKLDAALTMAETITSRGDELVQHYVSCARDAGCSWSLIGRRLGVSKQAARERFNDGGDLATIAGGLSPTVRLTACVRAAEAEAGEAPVRSEHQLLGLFQDGVGASVLERHGLTVDRARAGVAQLDDEIGHSQGAATDAFEARRNLERAASLARHAGHDYLGTEHLLAALILDPGSRAQRVLQRLDFDIAAAKRDLDQCVKPRRTPRRRRRHQHTMECAFCGKQRRDGVRLVAGPGVCICEHCVRLAADATADQRLG